MKTLIALLLAAAPVHARNQTGERARAARASGIGVQSHGIPALSVERMSGGVLAEQNDAAVQETSAAASAQIEDAEGARKPDEAVGGLRLAAPASVSNGAAEAFTLLPGRAKNAAAQAASIEVSAQVFDQAARRGGSVADPAFSGTSEKSKAIPLERSTGRAAKAASVAAAAGAFVLAAGHSGPAAAAGAAFQMPANAAELYALVHPALILLWFVPVVGLIWSAVRHSNSTDPVNQAKHWLRLSGGWHGMTAGMILGGLLATLLFATGSISSSFVGLALLKYGYLAGFLIGRDRFFIGGPRRLNALATMKWAKWGGFWAGGIALAVAGITSGGLRTLFAAGFAQPLLIAALVGLAGMAVAGAIGYRYPGSVDPNKQSAGAAVAGEAADPFTLWFLGDAIIAFFRIIGYLILAVLG